MKNINFKWIHWTFMIALIGAALLGAAQQAQAANLLSNGDLESGNLSPWSGYGLHIVSDTKYAGTYSLAVEGNQTGVQVVSGLTANTTYRLTGYVKVGSNDTIILGARNFGGTAVTRSSTSNSWTSLTLDFTTGSNNTSAEIYVQRSPAGAWAWGYADNLSLDVINAPTPTQTRTPTRTSTPAPATATATPSGGSNLLSNGDLESGNLSPWSGYGLHVVSDTKYAGTYSLAVEGNQTGVQVVSGLTANTTYRLTGYVKVGSNDTIILGARNFGGTAVTRSSTSNSWTSLTLDFTTGSSNTSAEIYVQRSPAGAWAWGYADNMTLTITSGSNPTNTPIPPTATPSGAPLPAGSTGGNWILTFQDEFNGTSLDTSKWSSGYGWGDRTDWTQEWCKPANIVVSGGLLNLKVTKEDNNGKPYASACVNTKNKFYQERGYFEIRMKPIKGNGWLNAFWSKRNTEEWPPELDVIEVIGPNTNRPYHTIHYNCPGTTTPCNSGSPDMDKGDLSAAFHTYGAEWQDNQVIWYVDGVETWRTSNNANLINGAFYLMVNVHVGSGWMGYPDANQQYPVTMQVDYVRAWRR